MSYAHELWPISGKSFFDIDNQSYLVHIKWSRNLKNNYQRLTENFFICGYKVCEKIVDSGHDNIKSDMWFLPSMYLFRQGMELGIKALTLDEYNWIKKYLLSLEEVDAKSDLFRFPFEDDFLSVYRDEFLDVVDMANSMLQAYGIIQKCLQIPESERIDRFDPARSTDFLQFASHGFGNCSLWKSISGDGFHKQVLGYSLSTEFLFYKTIEHGVPRNIFLSKRRSHLLYKELWKNVRPMIEYYAKAQGQDLEIIDIVESQIQELGNIDKNGDIFRYPTSYSLEYRFDNIDIDLNNTYEFMQGIFNFCDGCDGEFKAVAATTISEVERRTRSLVSELQKRHIHADVVKCCNEEYLQENYFHAVFEAAKSLSEKVREKTGL